MAEACYIFGDFAADGALPGDHQRVVIRRDQYGAPHLGDLAGDRLAVLALAVIEHHFGAERRRALALGPRRVARHHDHGRHVEERCRRRDALGVIAGRVGDDAALPHGRRDCREPVVGTTELERTGALERFRLEQHAAAGHGVERGRGQKRGAKRDAGQPARRRFNVGNGR